MKSVIINGKLVLEDGHEATADYLGKMFSILDVNVLHYKNICKMVASIPRYKNIKRDAIDEIAILCEKSDIPDGKNKLDMVLSYFEHARVSRVVKKFELTNKQKQLLFSAAGFLDLHKNEGHPFNKNIQKLYDVLGRTATRYSDDIEKQLEYAYKHFDKITKSEDVLVNHLVFSTSMCFALIETKPNIDDKLLKKIEDLSRKIFYQQEKLYGKTNSFKTSLRLVHRFTRKDY